MWFFKAASKTFFEIMMRETKITESINGSENRVCTNHYAKMIINDVTMVTIATFSHCNRLNRKVHRVKCLSRRRSHDQPSKARYIQLQAWELCRGETESTVVNYIDFPIWYFWTAYDINVLFTFFTFLQDLDREGGRQTHHHLNTLVMTKPDLT